MRDFDECLCDSDGGASSGSFFRVCLVEDCCGAFGAGWHEKAVELINGPQIAKANHHKSVGLYFGEVAGVEETMKGLECLL